MSPWIAPILHPASVLRGGWASAPQQVTYLTRVVDYVQGRREAPTCNIVEPPPGTQLWPTLATVAAFDTQMPRWDMLSVDIEAAGSYITLLGITCMSLERREIGPTLSLPFKMRGGEDYWHSWSDHVAVVEYLYGWLDDPSLGMVFHNGVSFDIPMLEEAGFSFRGRILDTMVLQHYCYPEMRKGLQYCTTLYNWTPCWKLLTDADDEQEGKA